MLLLFLGIAYLMAGSILLLQRSSLRVAQPGFTSLPPSLSLAAPPTALRAPGLGVRARSRWAAVQAVSGGGVKAGRHWPAPRSLGVRHLHRRWFHGLLPESPEQRNSLHRSSRPKGTTLSTPPHLILLYLNDELSLYSRSTVHPLPLQSTGRYYCDLLFIGDNAITVKRQFCYLEVSSRRADM